MKLEAPVNQNSDVGGSAQVCSSDFSWTTLLCKLTSTRTGSTLHPFRQTAGNKRSEMSLIWFDFSKHLIGQNLWESMLHLNMRWWLTNRKLYITDAVSWCCWLSQINLPRVILHNWTGVSKSICYISETPQWPHRSNYNLSRNKGDLRLCHHPEPIEMIKLH